MVLSSKIPAIIIILVAGFLFWNGFTNQSNQLVPALGKTPKDAEYVIDGKRTKLENGVAESEVIPGSASKTITRYFGNEVFHDFNNDGREDVVFLLTEERGGSGVFFYVVGALNTENGYVGSQALFLGDRIAPQSTHMGEGNVVVVNYADRSPGESFTVRPSLGKSIWLLWNTKTMQFGEVVQNFEGEADPKRMSLTMKSWVWIKTVYNDGKEVIPRTGKDFSITFKDGGKFSIGTDCNSMGGSYAVKDNKIIFKEMMTTLMYCPDSQESDFSGMISNSDTFHFTSRGELVLGLKFDSGSVVFR